MATEIKTDTFEGGSAVNVPTSSGTSLASALRDAADDITEIRTQYTALLAKLDADGGVTDADYAATLALSAQLLTKG